MKYSTSVVMLTNGNQCGLRVLDRLKAVGLELPCVLLETYLSPRDYLGKPQNGQPKAVDLAKCLFRWARANCFLRPKTRKAFQAVAGRVFETGKLNGSRMVADLQRIRPDFIILGGIGILRREVIECARLGVLNVHPGILPYIRGTGVVGRAIERRIPVGATWHYVNDGVDMGDILERRLLKLSGREQSLTEIERLADDLAVTMMVEAIVEHVAAGELPTPTQQKAKYPVCKWLSEAERGKVDEQIRGGLAVELFEKWRPLCKDDARNRIPIDSCHAPA